MTLRHDGCTCAIRVGVKRHAVLGNWSARFAMYRIKTADQGLNFLLIGLQCTTGRWKPRANQLDPSTRFDILTCDRHRHDRHRQSRCYSCQFRESCSRCSVDPVTMTASSSASWNRFSPLASNVVNGHVSTMWFMVCRWL